MKKRKTTLWWIQIIRWARRNSVVVERLFRIDYIYFLSNGNQGWRRYFGKEEEKKKKKKKKWREEFSFRRMPPPMIPRGNDGRSKWWFWQGGCSDAISRWICLRSPLRSPLTLPFYPSPSAQPSPFHHRFDARGCLPPSPSSPLPLPSPTLAVARYPEKPIPSLPPPLRLRALAQCRLKRLHCLKEAERTVVFQL